MSDKVIQVLVMAALIGVFGPALLALAGEILNYLGLVPVQN